MSLLRSKSMIPHVRLTPFLDYGPIASSPILWTWSPARAQFSKWALDLLSLTAVTDRTRVDAMRAALAALGPEGHRDWSQSDAQSLINAAGTAPIAGHVVVKPVAGQKTLLMWAAPAGTPRSRRLSYALGNPRPVLSLFSYLRSEKLLVPDGKCLEVPAHLVDTGDRLALAVHFDRAHLMDAQDADLAERRVFESSAD